MTPTTRSRLGCGLFLASVPWVYPLALAPAAWRGWGYIVVHGALAAAMLLVWRAQQQLEATEWAAANRRILRTGIAALALLIAAPPFTSHDTQRYLWDGRVVLAGENPYQVAPDDPRVAELRATWPTPAEHARYPTLYPPVALGLFALAASAGPGAAPWLWKWLVTAAAIGLLLLSRPRTPDAGRHWPLLALSPLLVLEVGVGAHVDVFSALLIAAALMAFARGAAVGAGLFLGLGSLVKLLPLLAAWPMLITLRRQAPRFLLALLGLLFAVYALVWLLLGPALGSLETFFRLWQFGSPGYQALESLLPPAAFKPALSGLAALGMGLAARLAWRQQTLAAIQCALAVPLLLSPVVFPWYLLALLPILARHYSAAVLAWTLLLPLTYEVLPRFDHAGVWTPADWPLWLLAGGLLLGAARDVQTLRSRQASRTMQPRMK